MLKILHLIIFFLALIWPLARPNMGAIAGGYTIPHQTARGLGLSNAMTAGVNDASAVYYNPAA
jgi:long-subunit fatty acid transport protein